MSLLTQPLVSPVALSLAALLLASAIMPAFGAETAQAAFRELLETSLKEKRGLKFYVNGETIGGAVTRFIGDEAVEVRNQEFSHIVIRLDRVDAIAGM
jgi:hypothetical protein